MIPPRWSLLSTTLFSMYLVSRIKEWCCHVKDPSKYRHKSLPFGKPPQNEDLIDSLSKLFRVYAQNAEKLGKLVVPRE